MVAKVVYNRGKLPRPSPAPQQGDWYEVQRAGTLRTHIGQVVQTAADGYQLISLDGNRIYSDDRVSLNEVLAGLTVLAGPLKVTITIED